MVSFVEKDISEKLVELQTCHYFNDDNKKFLIEDLIVKYKLIKEILKLTQNTHLSKISPYLQELESESAKYLGYEK